MLTSFLNIYAAITLGSGSTQPAIIDEASINLPASAIPIELNVAQGPDIEAAAAMITDFDSGKILYEKNSNAKLQIASITKLMTAIVALEQGDLNKTTYVSSNAARTEGSKAWLLPGEEIKLSSLLYASLIHSGNDAAVAIAEEVGGDIPSFVERMNLKAKEIGLLSTKFENPIGFDSPDNYSTVYDLSLLARYAFRNDFIRNAVKNQTMTISSANGGITHDLVSTNQLLGNFLNVLGLKTGHTEGAGLCFVSVIENERGNKIITVVLDSPDRFLETKKLANWAFKSHIW